MSNLTARWRSICAAVISLLVVSSVAFASNDIVLQIKDMPLRDVINLIVSQSGCKIIVADDSKLDKRVSANLSDVPLESALDAIVGAAGVGYTKDEQGIYIVGGPKMNAPIIKASDLAAVEVPAVEEPEMLAAVYQNEYEKPYKEPVYTKYNLSFAKPSEVLAMLGPDRGALKSVTRRMSSKYNNFRMHRISPGQPVIPMDYAEGDLGAGRTAGTVEGAAQNIGGGGYAGPRRGAAGYGGAAGPAGGFVQPGAAGGQYTGSSVSGYGGDMFVPEGIEDIRAFDIDNSLLIKGDEDAIAKFKEILRLLDVAPAQVEIKAEFVQVSTSMSKKLGIDWSLQRLNEAAQTEFNPTGNVSYSLATGNLTAQLKAELTNSVGRVINSPIISCTNNFDAFISIGKEIPYWTSSQTTSSGVTSQTYSVDFITIDTSLEVTPRVNGDGSITMFLAPSVNGQGVDYKGPDGTLIPEQLTQELETERIVKNGETIVVGGLITKKENNGYQRIPLLSKLPLIGSLFRTEDASDTETELLIFITPTIISEKKGFSDAGIGSIAP